MRAFSRSLPFSFSLLAALLLSSPAQAVPGLHASAMLHGELLQGDFPGQDYSLLYRGQWGLRLTQRPEQRLDDQAPSRLTASGLEEFSLVADYRMPMLLRLLDYRTQEALQGPFDFLTAYAGVGYAKLKAKLTHQLTQAQGSQLVQSESTEELELPTTALSFGFYGGEKFVVIDARLLWHQSQLQGSDLVEDQKFQHWKMILGLGLGF